MTLLLLWIVLASVRLKPDATDARALASEGREAAAHLAGGVRLQPDLRDLAGGVRLQPDRGDAPRGKQTYDRVGCYQCHGREAQGASTGPRLGPDPLPLAAFTRYVRTPRADMPPYTIRILSDAELADIYAFVSSRPRPRPVK